MVAQHVRRYIDLLTGRYHSISSIWLMGSRASSTERPESDWDLLAFADRDALGEMQGDADVRAPGIDLLVVIDDDRFEQPWIDEGEIGPKFGFLDVWRWTQNSQTEATYLSSRNQQTAPAVRLWPRE
jgi:hypothetical protein